MKLYRSSLLALLLFIVVPVLSFAATKKSINLSEPVKVGSTVLKPGDYTVQWDGGGPSVQVTFKQNNKEVATAPATLQKPTSNYDGALDLTAASGDQAKTLHAIEFKNTALVFGQESMSTSQ